jgi:drug/metabolite transporter (DMT)-like permease
MIDADGSARDRRLTKGYAIALAGTAVWSTTAIFIRYLTENYGLPPLVLVFWRDLFVGLGIAAVLAVVAPRMLRVERRHWPFLLLYGFILAIFNSLWTVAVAHTGAAVATVLSYSSAAYTAVLAWWILGERLDGVKIAAVLLSLGGCVLVAGAYNPAAWQLNPLGLTAGLLAGAAFAFYNIMGRTAAQRNIPPWSTTFCIFLSAAGFLLLFQAVPVALDGAAAAPQLFWLGTSLAGWGLLIALALGPTAAGYGLYTVSLTYLPASVVGLVATLEPAFTAILAYFLLGERLSPIQIAGTGLILLGVVLLRVKSQPNPA